MVAKSRVQEALEDEVDESKLTKQQLRNKKRAEKRRKEKQAQQEVFLSRSAPAEETFFGDEVFFQHQKLLSSPVRALSSEKKKKSSSRKQSGRTRTEEGGFSSEDEVKKHSSDEELETYGDVCRRLKRLSKTLKQIKEAKAKLDSSKIEDPLLVAKVAREALVRDDFEQCERELQLVEDKREARRVARKAANFLLAKAREAEAELLLSVTFDEKFACPICTEVLEASITVPRACHHVFCRSCLEDHVAKATKASDCLCPMCRQPLCDPKGRVEAKPAAARHRMKHELGTCHCGHTMPLNVLRDHLRQCGPKATSLFPPRRKFGHEFKQPNFQTENTHSRGGSYQPTSAQEQLQLQAALLASVRDR